MKILVLGGSRFLGKAFVEEAQNNGHEITVFNRGNNNDVLKNVEILIGDRNGSLELLKNRHWDAVLDTSGLIPRSVSSITSLLKDKTEFYAFVSSISVYQDWVPKGINENYYVQSMSVEEADRLTSEPAASVMEYYGQFKTLCEQEAERNMPGKVLNIRAGQLVGENDYTDRLPYWVNRMARGGRVLAPGNPESSFVQLIDVKDMAIWILKMMEEKCTGTYNVTGKPILLEEVLLTCKEVAGTNAELIWADEDFILVNKVAPWTEMPLWLPVKTLLGPEHKEPWSGTFHININKALQTGLKFRPLAETIREVHDWLKANPIDEASLKAGIRSDREKSLLDKIALIQ